MKLTINVILGTVTFEATPEELKAAREDIVGHLKAVCADLREHLHNKLHPDDDARLISP